jgi:hypothetical protein
LLSLRTQRLHTNLVVRKCPRSHQTISAAEKSTIGRPRNFLISGMPKSVQKRSGGESVDRPRERRCIWKREADCQQSRLEANLRKVRILSEEPLSPLVVSLPAASHLVRLLPDTLFSHANVKRRTLWQGASRLFLAGFMPVSSRQSQPSASSVTSLFQTYPETGG